MHEMFTMQQEYDCEVSAVCFTSTTRLCIQFLAAEDSLPLHQSQPTCKKP